MLACLVFAVLTAGLQVLSWNANRAAADNTEQLVRVQNIQSTLFRADALATTTFLTGGLEPPEQRAAYDEAIETVTRQITEAAEAQPADREALADLSTAVTDYNATIAQARANNRQGFPVGAEYLRTASTGLRDTSVEGSAIPIAQALVAANAERAEDELGAQHPFLILLPGLAALALLCWVNRQLARPVPAPDQRRDRGRLPDRRRPHARRLRRRRRPGEQQQRPARRAATTRRSASPPHGPRPTTPRPTRASG